MPHKARKPCSHQSCINFVEVGQIYCDIHKALHKDDYQRRHPEYQKLYNNRWHKYRKWFLNEHPLCVNYETCHNVATVVHHKKDHKGDYVKFWQADNHEALCNTCHENKHKNERWGMKNE